MGGNPASNIGGYDVWISARNALSFGEQLGAVISVDPMALDGKLSGLPILIKDCIDVQGLVTTFGSAIHDDSVPADVDAFVSARLRESGYAITGKASLTEFCFGATGENAHFGNALNPWDTKRITGGSSSGSAAVVACGIVPVALGTDTGGSVRIPSALCGIVGLRPTIGRVSNSGCLEVSSAYDTIGPMACDVESAAHLYDVIQGFDRSDPLSIATGENAVPRLGQTIDGMRVGVARPYFCEEADADVLACFEAALGALQACGAKLEDIALGDTQERREQNAIRFIAADVAEAREDIREHMRDRVGAEFLRRLDIGASLSGVDYAASYRSLLRLKQALRNHFYSGLDAIVTPTTPCVAPLWSESADMVATTKRVASFTYDIGAAGVPALSVPIGFGNGDMPVGMQVIGAWGNDALLFQIAHAIEAKLEFGKRRPPVHV